MKTIKTIYLVEKVAFIDGYWGYAFSPVKAFTSKEKAEEFLSTLREGRVVKIELEDDDRKTRI